MGSLLSEELALMHPSVLIKTSMFSQKTQKVKGQEGHLIWCSEFFCDAVRHWPEHLSSICSFSSNLGDRFTHCFTHMSTLHRFSCRRFLEIMTEPPCPVNNTAIGSNDHHIFKQAALLITSRKRPHSGHCSTKWDVVRSQDKGHFLALVSLISSSENLKREADRDGKAHTAPLKVLGNSPLLAGLELVILNSIVSLNWVVVVLEVT